MQQKPLRREEEESFKPYSRENHEEPLWLSPCLQIGDPSNPTWTDVHLCSPRQEVHKLPASSSTLPHHPHCTMTRLLETGGLWGHPHGTMQRRGQPITPSPFLWCGWWSRERALEYTCCTPRQVTYPCYASVSLHVMGITVPSSQVIVRIVRMKCQVYRPRHHGWSPGPPSNLMIH